MYQRLDEAVRDLRDRLGGLPSPAEAEDLWSDIWHQEAHTSTAIEGNTLVLKEVEKLLEEGRAVGAKPLRDSPSNRYIRSSAATEGLDDWCSTSW